MLEGLYRRKNQFSSRGISQRAGRLANSKGALNRSDKIHIYWTDRTELMKTVVEGRGWGTARMKTTELTTEGLLGLGKFLKSRLNLSFYSNFLS